MDFKKSNEYIVASRILEQFNGEFVEAKGDYEFFAFVIPNKVRILFYPHTVSSTKNQHCRIRNQNSKDEDLAMAIMYLLDASQHSCYFTVKNKHQRYCNLSNKKAKEILKNKGYDTNIADEVLTDKYDIFHLRYIGELKYNNELC